MKSASSATRTSNIRLVLHHGVSRLVRELGNLKIKIKSERLHLNVSLIRLVKCMAFHHLSMSDSITHSFASSATCV